MPGVGFSEGLSCQGSLTVLLLAGGVVLQPSKLGCGALLQPWSRALGYPFGVFGRIPGYEAVQE